MKADCDMTVIGGGAAGLTASGIAVSLGAKTTLVEAQKLGGDCTWYGCVPSKTLLKAAKLLHQFRTAHRYGLRDAQPEFDFATVIKHVHKTQQHVYEDADAPGIYEKLGVKVIFATAQFLDSHTLRLTDKEGNVSKLTSKYFVIGAGSSPVVPPIDGIAGVDYLTNENVFLLSSLPKRVVIAGAGPIGTEMSQAFTRLGSEVTVINRSEGILPRDDRELADLLKRVLESEGVRYHLQSQIKRVERRNGSLKVTIEGKVPADPNSFEGDALLLSVGRRPNTGGLNLEAAGVAHNERGIIVNDHCRSSTRNIFACGDVTDRFQFTHFAEHMAKVAVTNALLHLPVSLDSKHITWCTYTDPELAHVGMTEEQLRKNGTSYELYRFPFAKIDRAITENETAGWIKVYASRFSGKIYGVDILGANAGEMIGEYALAMRNGVTLRKVADTIHPYPTYVLGNRRAADQWYVRKQSRAFVWLLQKLFRLKGQLPDTSDSHRIV